MRYFFHLHDDIACEDEDGREFPDQSAARGHAIDEARTMAAESVRHGQLDLSHYVEVTDQAGATLFRVTFGEAVAVFSNPAT